MASRHLRILFLIFTLLYSIVTYAQNDPELYSIEKIVHNVKPENINTITDFEYELPDFLYHWASIGSLGRLQSDKNWPEDMPLKSLGTPTTKTLFVANAPAFYNKPGLFAWHNPVGAMSGGSGEVYGKGEAILKLELNKNAKVGLIVTTGDFTNAKPTENFKDPSITSRYDLVLHLNGSFYEGRFLGYFEWIVLSPTAISSVTANPQETILLMEKFIRLIEEQVQLGAEAYNALETHVAGPQHADGAAIGPERIEYRIESLRENMNRIPKDFMTVVNFDNQSEFVPNSCTIYLSK